jgi:hypothetical protein
MKIKTISLLAFVVLSFGATAQRRFNLSMGPTAGANFSTLYGQLRNSAGVTDGEYKTRTGFNAGIFLNHSIKYWAGLRMEFLYSQLGANVTGARAYEDIRLHYLQVPLLATYFFGKENRPGVIRPKLFVGPHVGFKLGTREKYRNESELRVTTGNYTGMDFGVTAGAGFNYALANQRWINFDVRYGLGLINVINRERVPNLNASNGALSVNLGFSFPLGNYSSNTGRFTR